MLQRIEQHNARQPPESKIQVSVEVEKPREELYQLFGYGDVVSVPCSTHPLPHTLPPAPSHIQLNLVLKWSLSIPLSCLSHMVMLAGGGKAKRQRSVLWALAQTSRVAKK